MVSLAMNIAAFLFLAWIGLILLGILGEIIDALPGLAMGCFFAVAVLIFVAVTGA